MGFRFRKSKKLPGGARVNLSNSGVGFSWGFKGFRKTWKAGGGTRTTYSIPGTGLSYVKESGTSRGRSSASNGKQNVYSGTKGISPESMQPENNSFENEPESEKKTPIWLWILGWVLVFPLPLTVLLNRERRMSFGVKFAALAIMWIMYFGMILMLIAVVFGGSGSSNSGDSRGIPIEESSESVAVTAEPTPAESEVVTTKAPDPVEVEALIVNLSENDIGIGENALATVTISPSDADDKTVTWASSDPSVATIDKEGQITGVSGGTVTITAEVANGVSAKAELMVDDSRRLMRLKVTRQRRDDINIGNEWTYVTLLNGQNPPKNLVIAVGDTLEFYAKYKEEDQLPDSGENTVVYTVKSSDIQDGFSVPLEVIVTENAGRNQGKSAEFVVTFTFMGE